MLKLGMVDPIALLTLSVTYDGFQRQETSGFTFAVEETSPQPTHSFKWIKDPNSDVVDMFFFLTG